MLGCVGFVDVRLCWVVVGLGFVGLCCVGRFSKCTSRVVEMRTLGRLLKMLACVVLCWVFDVRLSWVALGCFRVWCVGLC